MTIFEASERFGGRLKSVSRGTGTIPLSLDFAKFPLEAGGQVLDFKDNAYYKMALSVGVVFSETDYMDGMQTWDPY